MNRLSLGAAGLLVALAMFSTASATHKDDKKSDVGAATRLAFVKMTRDVLSRHETNTTKFKDLTALINKYKDMSVKLQKDAVKGMNESMQQYLDKFSNQLNGRMNNLSRDAADDSFKSILNFLRKRMNEVTDEQRNAEMKKDEQDVDLSEDDKTTLKFLKDESSTDDSNIVLKHAYNMHLEQQAEEAFAKPEGVENHVHGTTYTRAQWAQVYNGLPDTSKYAHNGLHPKIKAHLSAGLKIAESKYSEHYKDLKEKSQEIIKKHATEARQEALAHANTQAAKYLKEHNYVPTNTKHARHAGRDDDDLKGRTKIGEGGN